MHGDQFANSRDIEFGDAGFRSYYSSPVANRSNHPAAEFNGPVQLTQLAGSPAFFDLTGNGFARRTGWATGGDGFLVLDRNGNGRIDNINELFGNSTTGGFAVLGSLDSNGDGVIDTNDSDFSKLQVWIDSNQDGFTNQGELHTLAELGIASISLNATSANIQINGNSISAVSTFTRTDGTTGEIADAWFATDTTNTRYVREYQLNLLALLLPDLRAYGTVPDLHIAMSQDSVLFDMVSQLAAEDISNSSRFTAQVEQMLYRWAGVDNVAAAAAAA